MTVLALISSIVIFDDAVAYAINVVAVVTVVAIDQSLVGTLWSDCLNNEWKGYCSRRGIFPNSKTKNDENYASHIFLHRTALRCVHKCSGTVTKEPSNTISSQVENYDVRQKIES